MTKFMPISDPEAIVAASHERVVPHIVLPVGVDTERILLNVPVAARIGSLAGANQLHLVTVDGSPQNPFDAVDVNMGSDGVAYAGGLHDKERKRQVLATYDNTGHLLLEDLHFPPKDSKEVRHNKRDLQCYKAKALGLYVSKGAIEGAIRNDDYDRGLVDEAGWAKYLNRDFKLAAFSAALERYAMMPNEDLRGFLGQLWPLAWRAKLLQEVFSGDQAAMMHATRWHAIGVMTRILQLTPVFIGGADLRDYNWSFINSYRLDRIVATAGYANTHRLIKVAK